MCASSSTTQTCGLARDDGVDVHLLERDAAVLDRAARHTLEVLQLRLGVGAAVGLDDADHHVEAARAQGVRLLEHRVGLADAGRGADVDAQARPVLLLEARQQGVGGRSRVVGHVHRRMGCALVERQVQHQDVHDRFAQDAELAALGVGIHQLPHGVFGQPTLARDARHLENRRGRADVRVEPRARGRDQVDRNGHAGIVRLAAAPRRAATRSISFLLVGPRFDPDDAPRRNRRRRPRAASRSSRAS